MERLNDILRELGISKVKLAKGLGVSRQMIYNYLELDDINKWPKDKKVILLNILGIKSADELNDIKVDTDYIISLVFKFDIASGLCNSFNTEINVLEIIKNLNNTNNVSISSFTEFNILISFNVNYNGNVVIDTLTEAEKANYIEYNPNLEEVPSF